MLLAPGTMRKSWIRSAISRPGSFTKKAKRAGKSVAAYAQAEKHAPGRLGKQARLAITLRKISRSKKRGAKRKAKR